MFRLYTYGFVGDVPDFVDQRDADAIVPRTEIFQAHGGVETFADLFAYRFLERLGGWWVDSDVVCNASLLPEVEIAFAEERTGVINNAVLKFPRNHPVLVELLNHIATLDPVNSEWGATGPLALTAICHKHDLTRHKRQTNEFYPLHWKEAPKLLFPEFTDEVLARTADSAFVHLWGATLREMNFDFNRSRPPKGSYMDMVYAKFLDPHIAGALQPIDDEAAFRISVKEYIEKSWNVSLPLA